MVAELTYDDVHLLEDTLVKRIVALYRDFDNFILDDIPCSGMPEFVELLLQLKSVYKKITGCEYHYSDVTLETEFQNFVEGVRL